MAQKITWQGILKSLVFLFSFVLPLILLVAALFLTVFTAQQTVVKEEVSEEPILAEEKLVPSLILNNKSKYNQQEIVIRGKVIPAPVVCERKTCPPDDLCCGCPTERNLIIVDEGRGLTPETKGQLRLLDPTGMPFCQRHVTDCDYDCQDWVKGAVYDVSGTFYAEPPPWAWKLALEYYFQVSSKNRVRTIGLGESLGNILEDVKEMFKQLTTSGYYVVQ